MQNWKFEYNIVRFRSIRIQHFKIHIQAELIHNSEIREMEGFSMFLRFSKTLCCHNFNMKFFHLLLCEEFLKVKKSIFAFFHFIAREKNELQNYNHVSVLKI